MTRWLRRATGSEQGQTSAEFVALLLIVGALIAALLVARPGMSQMVADGVRTSLCMIFGSPCDGETAVAGNPDDVTDGLPGPPADGGEPGAGPDGNGEPDGGGETGDVPGGGGESDDDQAFIPYAIGQWGQFFGGAGAQLWDEVKGIGDTAAWVWRSATSSDQRRENGEVWDAIWDDPWGAARSVWDGMWEPAVAEHEAGRTPAAVGRGTAVVLTAIFGGKGLTKLSRLRPDHDVLPDRVPDADGRRDRGLDPCPRPANSFVAATRVLLADGSTLPIADISPGTMVLAADPERGVMGARPVTAVITGTGVKHLVDISVGGAVVSATAGHPFAVAGTGDWIDAAALRAGDHLRTPAGAQIAVDGVAHRAEDVTVYNLTVADLHTYFVLAGDDAVLVHNQDDCVEGEEPGGSAPVPDPVGGAVTYGPNTLSHLRSHAQDLRTAARADGIEIPRSPTKPETQAAMKDYIHYVVNNPHQRGVGPYKTYPDAIWSRRGDLIIVRQASGEFITALRQSGGRAATNAPWMGE